jgi:hypothetical protein
MDKKGVKTGDLVSLRAFGGKTITRRVVRQDGETVCVCCEAEYTAANKQGRVPECIGFPIQDVIGKHKTASAK